MRSLTSLSLLPELAAVEVEADVTREEEAMVVPVRAARSHFIVMNVEWSCHKMNGYLLESRVWTEDRALVTELMADSMEVTWVFMEVFSKQVDLVQRTKQIICKST